MGNVQAATHARHKGVRGNAQQKTTKQEGESLCLVRQLITR
ncbi:hypothetical protein HMPREF3190_00093 [Umbribacter vaginalis]|nr:hypothetical protein HMPREF3190_00093 [Coriobacteriales bacterium DNF00809]